jgi:protein-tyrosine-phosphatase
MALGHCQQSSDGANMSADYNPVLLDYPNSASNALLMMSFSNRPQQRKIRDTLRQTLSRYGKHVLRADEKAYAGSLWDNVKFYLDACELGIAVFDQLVTSDFNPNVSLELGYMLARQRKVLLLKERSLPPFPSDILGQLYKEFDIRNVKDSVSGGVLSWLQDIGIAKSPAEKLVVFVSYGGTCRCAMSKVVAQRAFSGRNLPFPIRFVSMAAVYGDSVSASDGARRAVTDTFGSDLLESHRVMRRNQGTIDDADLILVMSKKLAKGLPAKKTRLITEFFGSKGDVKNPWPDSVKGANKKYAACLNQLRKLIEPNGDVLLRALSPELKGPPMAARSAPPSRLILAGPSPRHQARRSRR